ncbi:MAG: flagellar basal body L-ring protein FlgH [Ignavibacteria bacterium]|jgi:flagellar L-ring protein precursor FlgH
MKKFITIIAVLPLLLQAQDLRSNASRSLFSDYKASRIGDAVTIIVVESSVASNSSQTKTGKSSDVGYNLEGLMDGSSLLPSVDLSLGSNNDFEGGGSINSSGSVQTKISALIDSVLANGLVRIRGSRRISINGEEQNIFIKGIVRTADLNSDNTVYSYNISEAEIILENEGRIEGASNPGLLTKIFHWLF